MDQLNALQNLFQKHPIKVSMFLWACLVSYMTLNFVPREVHNAKVEEYRLELELVKAEAGIVNENLNLFKQAYDMATAAHETEVATQKERLNEKIDLLKQHTEEIVLGRIGRAVLEERLKNIKEQLKK